MDAPGSLLAPCFNPQKASDNYLRLCQLIALLCGDLFRDILSRYIKPTNLRSELDNNKQKLVNIFNKQQQDQIYPATGNKLLTANDFDIPIIYILLRNICNIPSHKTGWGNHPAKGDNSIAAGIEIIRLTRNSILAHSTNGMIEDPVFEKHWKELRNVVVQIEKELTGSELYKRGVDFLHSCNLTSVRTEAYDNGEKSKQDGVERIYDKRSARFAEFFDEIAESVPVEKTARLKDFIQNSCKAEDITSLKEAMSPRDCLRYLRDAKLFTSSYVIFVQYLFKRIDCKEQFAECYKYAEEQEALCFYEKPPANGYKNVLFHVKGNLSDYSSERITEIRETVADLLKCTSEEILIGGACPSTSFLLVLSIKDAYSCKLLTLEQCDKDKLTKLDIDYTIVDLIMINLEPSKEFGWNIYFDPKHFTREDENMHLQEKISISSPSQHITTLFEKGSPTNEDSVSGCPTVTLNPVHLALQDELVEIKATIRGFPKCQSVTWMKDNQRINTTDPKYEGSIDSCEFPVLCIKEVKEEDTGVYKVIARNELGEGESSEDLEVIGNSGVFSTSKQEHGLRLFEHQSEIERLSSNDPKLIQSTCDIMNRVCSKGKDLHKMIEKFGDEKKLNQAPINEETHYRAQRTERPMRYADRRFSDNADSAVKITGEKNAKVGKTLHLKGRIPDGLTVKYIKWQKYHNGEFADIKINEPKYKGTTTTVENPELVLNDIDLLDGVEYRMLYMTDEKEQYSESLGIKIEPGDDGAYFSSDKRKTVAALQSLDVKATEEEQSEIKANTENDTKYLGTRRLELHSSEITSIQIYSNQKDTNDRYYVGEHVLIKANYGNPSVVHTNNVTWKKKTDTGTYLIDIKSPRFSVTRDKLEISSCRESDVGTYFLSVDCRNNLGIKSNKIHLKVVEDIPTVILKGKSKAIYDETVEYRAIIRCSPKQTRVIWKKGTNDIDIKLPKYYGSSEDGDHPILRIKHVKKGDEDIYGIEVHNELGKVTCEIERLVVFEDSPVVDLKILEPSQVVPYGKTVTLKADIKGCSAPFCIWERETNGNIEKINSRSGKFLVENLDASCQKLTIENFDFSDKGKYSISVTNSVVTVSASLELKLEVHEMIFISGPGLVSPTKLFKFQATLSDQTSNGKWWKIKDGTTEEIKIDNKKYFTYYKGNICEIEIYDAEEEDSATYQFSLNNIKSNKIYTLVDDSAKFSTKEQGNCLRFFALQATSADTMRKVLNDLPDTFENLINNVRESKDIPEGKKKELRKSLENIKSSRELDISLMYKILRNSEKLIGSPTNCWGQLPKKTEIGKADDIERIHHYKNLICHKDASEMNTDEFNESTLDLIEAIRRLSKDDEELIKNACETLNRFFTKGEELITMIGDLEYFREKEKIWDKLLHEEIQFHTDCESGIVISGDLKTAHRPWSHEGGGVCFVHQHMNTKLGKEIHIRGLCANYSDHLFGNSHNLKIGLTNTNPDNIFCSDDSFDTLNALKTSLKPVACKCKTKGLSFEGNFEFSILLLENSKLLIKYENAREEYHSFPDVSTIHPMWLVFELLNISSIWISQPSSKTI